MLIFFFETHQGRSEWVGGWASGQEAAKIPTPLWILLHENRSGNKVSPTIYFKEVSYQAQLISRCHLVSEASAVPYWKEAGNILTSGVLSKDLWRTVSVLQKAVPLWGSWCDHCSLNGPGDFFFFTTNGHHLLLTWAWNSTSTRNLRSGLCSFITMGR